MSHFYGPRWSQNRGTTFSQLCRPVNSSERTGNYFICELFSQADLTTLLNFNENLVQRVLEDKKEAARRKDLLELLQEVLTKAQAYTELGYQQPPSIVVRYCVKFSA